MAAEFVVDDDEAMDGSVTEVENGPTPPMVTVLTATMAFRARAFTLLMTFPCFDVASVVIVALDLTLVIASRQNSTAHLVTKVFKRRFKRLV